MKYLIILIFCITIQAQAILDTKGICKEEIDKVIAKKIQNKHWFNTHFTYNEEKIPGFHYLDFKSNTSYKFSAKKSSVIVAVHPRYELMSKIYEFVEPQCKAKVSTFTPIKARLPSESNPFTDNDLVSLVQTLKWGVIYVWTESMPLSIRAVAEIKKAVQEKGGQLTILYDPYSRVKDLKKVAFKNGISINQTRRMLSDELFQRGFGLHYPAAIVYTGGNLSRRSYFGHKTSKMYKSWIEEELKRIPKENSF